MDLKTNEIYSLAEPVIKQVVDLIAEKKYYDIPQFAELESWTVADMEEAIDGFLELNDLPYIDKFDTPCDFHPKYEYHQLYCNLYKDGSGFHVDYGLTTDRELNDLTLQMEFLFTDSDTVKARFLDVHVM